MWERVQTTLTKEQAAQSRVARHPTARVLPVPAERVPRITRLLALAQKFEGLIGSGVVNNYAALAEVGQVSRSRVTQMTSGTTRPSHGRVYYAFEREENVTPLRCQNQIAVCWALDFNVNPMCLVIAQIEDRTTHRDPELKVSYQVPAVNPGIRDRVNAVNSMLCNSQGRRRLFVDPFAADFYHRESKLRLGLLQLRD